MLDPVKQIQELIDQHRAKVDEYQQRLIQNAEERKLIEKDLDALKQNDPIPGLQSAIAALRASGTPVAASPAPPAPKAEEEPKATAPEVKRTRVAPRPMKRGESVHSLIHGLRRLKDPDAVEMVALHIESKVRVTLADLSDEFGLDKSTVRGWTDSLIRLGLVEFGNLAIPQNKREDGTNKRTSREVVWIGPNLGRLPADAPKTAPPNNVVQFDRNGVLPVAGTGRQTASRADLKPIFAELRRNGFTVDSTGKHYKVRNLQRKVVLVISKTPSDQNAIHQIKRDVRALGVQVA